MASTVPNKSHLREVMLYFFNANWSAAVTYRHMLATYGNRSVSHTTCRQWFRRFREGNFDLKDKLRENRPKKFENHQLQTLLDDDDTQSQTALAEQLGVTQRAISIRLHAMGKIQKVGKWVPHALNDRQMERRQSTCEYLLARHNRKSFLHRIVTGDEKWVFFANPQRKKSWVDPGQPSTSTAKPDRFGRKMMLCVWWDQEGVVYRELLKPGETVDAHRYHQQLTKLHEAMCNKRSEYKGRHAKLILLHDNAPSHTSAVVREYLSTLKWEVLPHPPYSPDLAPTDYHLFASMGHALKGQHFSSFDAVNTWVDQWFASKEQQFFRRGIHNLPDRWMKCVDNEGTYFE